jgi:hypothetical protein
MKRQLGPMPSIAQADAPFKVKVYTVALARLAGGGVQAEPIFEPE